MTEAPFCEKTLLQILPGETFHRLLVAVSDVSFLQARNGNHYLNLRIRDASGPRGAKFFNASQALADELKARQFAWISGRVDNTDRYRGEFKIETLEPASAPENPEHFDVPLPRQHAAHRRRFKEILASVREPNLQTLLQTIFSGEKWEQFCEAPAASKNHHAHRGGLLEHSGEVALLCDRVTQVLPHLDRDLLVGAALLHDIGKLDEMEFEVSTGATQYTSAGHLVGHVVLGACTVSCVADGLPDFPGATKHALMHLILSHHGEPEWGAARRPMCVEAIILHQCDLMSARSASCRDLIGAGDGDFLKFPDFHSAPRGGQHSVFAGLMRPLLEGEIS